MPAGDFPFRRVSPPNASARFEISSAGKRSDLRENLKGRRPAHNPLTLRLLAPIAASTNLLWELAQMPAYRSAGISVFVHIAWCVFASIGDTAMTYGIVGIAYAVLRRVRSAPHGLRLYATTAIVGLPVVALVEYVALHAGFWAYDPSMPTLFGSGIFPLLQLSVLSPIALALSELLSRRTPDDATRP